MQTMMEKFSLNVCQDMSTTTEMNEKHMHVSKNSDCQDFDAGIRMVEDPIVLTFTNS